MKTLFNLAKCLFIGLSAYKNFAVTPPSIKDLTTNFTFSSISDAKTNRKINQVNGNNDGNYNIATTSGAYTSDGGQPTNEKYDGLKIDNVVDMANYGGTTYALIYNQKTDPQNAYILYFDSVNLVWKALKFPDSLSNLRSLHVCNLKFFVTDEGIYFFMQKEYTNIDTDLITEFYQINLKANSQVSDKYIQIKQSSKIQYIYKVWGNQKKYFNKIIAGNNYFFIVDNQTDEVTLQNTPFYLLNTKNLDSFSQYLTSDNFEQITWGSSGLLPSNAQCTDITIDNLNDLWIASKNGVYEINSDTFISKLNSETFILDANKDISYLINSDTKLDSSYLLSDNYCNCISSTSEGTILIGTQTKLNVLFSKNNDKSKEQNLTSRTWNNYGSDKSITQNGINTILITLVSTDWKIFIAGNDWIATNTFSNVAKQDNNNDDSKLIIGLSIGLGVGIPLFILLIYIAYRLKKIFQSSAITTKRKTKKQERDLNEI